MRGKNIYFILGGHCLNIQIWQLARNNTGMNLDARIKKQIKANTQSLAGRNSTINIAIQTIWFQVTVQIPWWKERKQLLRIVIRLPKMHHGTCGPILRHTNIYANRIGQTIWKIYFLIMIKFYLWKSNLVQYLLTTKKKK